MAGAHSGLRSLGLSQSCLRRCPRWHGNLWVFVRDYGATDDGNASRAQHCYMLRPRCRLRSHLRGTIRCILASSEWPSLSAVTSKTPMISQAQRIKQQSIHAFISFTFYLSILLGSFRVLEPTARATEESATGDSTPRAPRKQTGVLCTCVCFAYTREMAGGSYPLVVEATGWYSCLLVLVPMLMSTKPETTSVEARSVTMDGDML